jgi:hypothetical protein
VYATAAFVHGSFDFFPGLPGVFLDAANQFIFLAFDELQIVIREPCKLLFQLALGNVPVSFGGKNAHTIWLFISFCRVIQRHKFLLQVACRPIEEIFFQKNQVLSGV